MNQNTFNEYKIKLEKERDMLFEQLEKLGIHSEKDSTEWVPRVPLDLDTNTADESEIADRSEETQIDEIVLEELETRYKNIVHALKKFDTNTYGVCEISGDPIEKERLDANPAARTCKKHLNTPLQEIL
jgi:RNA polymerase-binding transcription factor DksA